MLYRIFGKSGYGKTHYIYSKLAECIQNKTHAFLIVPEHAALMVEKQIVKELGNKSNLYIEVINFKRLCNRVFRQTGGLALANIDSGAKKLLMADALEQICQNLTEFKQAALNPDFAQKALETVNQLHLYGIDTQLLEKTADELDKQNKNILSSKIRELSVISAAFDANLTQCVGTSKDIYDRLCEKLSQTDFFAGKKVFIDSFYGFTHPELKIISHLLEQADEVYVSLLYDGKDKDRIFERSRKSAASLYNCAKRCGCDVKDIYLCENHRHKKQSALYEFEKNFSSHSLALPENKNSLDGMYIHSCKDIHAEAKCAASIITKLVQDGAKFSDIYVCAKNLQDYEGIVDTVFDKSDISLSLQRPFALCDSVICDFILSGIEAATTFSQSSVLKLIKTGLFCLDDVQADIFETYVRTWNISSSLLKTDKDWYMNPDGYVESIPDAEILNTVNTVRAKIFTCLDAFSNNLKNSETIKDFSLAVWNFLCDTAKEKGLDAFDDGADGRDVDLLCKCLDSMVEFLGDKKCTPSRFSQLFKLVSSEYSIGKLPDKNDMVGIFSVDLVRQSGKKHVILLGANDGIFPSSSKQGGFFSDSEKKILESMGLDFAESSDEKLYDELFLAYTAICSASQSCHIIFSQTDLSGETLYRSGIVSSVMALTGAKITHFDEKDVLLSYAGRTLAFESLVTMPDSEEKSTLLEYFSSLPEFKEKLENLSKTHNESDRLSKETLSSLYGKDITTSYSRLEKFNECPFSHFCTYTLGLKSEPVAKLGPLEAGSIMHRVLEQFVPILAKAKNSGQPMSKKQARTLICEILESFFENIAKGTQNAHTKRFKYLYNRLSRLLGALAENLADELLHSKFTPCDFELTISDKSDVKPAKIPISESSVLKIVGQIDRVDIYKEDGKGYIRIIDYKTGSKVFKKDDILAGFNLQMLLYLYSVVTQGSSKYKSPLIPAGVLYTNVTAPDSKADLGYDDNQAIDKSVPKAITSGVLIDDENILRAMDDTENATFIPVKVGTVDSDSIMSLEKLGELLNFACNTAALLAKEIHQGLKVANPFKNNRIDACRHCEMAPVCQGFDSFRNSNRHSLDFEWEG